MNIHKLQVKLATHYYPEVIDGIYDSSVGMKARLEKDLEAKAKEIEADGDLDPDDKAELLSSLGDDLFIAELTTELAGEMMIVALYKTVEISIKKMAKGSGLFTDKQIASFYKAGELRKVLKNKVCDLKALPKYAQYDELRCINNSVKHSGVANNELAQYPGWKKGQKLNELHIHYGRLRNDVDSFVVNLQSEILRKI
jgi:hypothetical protein